MQYILCVFVNSITLHTNSEHIISFFAWCSMYIIYRAMDIQLICDENRNADQHEFVFDREEFPGYYYYVSNDN